MTLKSLRQLVAENATLKLFALGLAVIMWSFVASQQRGQITEIKFSAPVVLKNIPPELVVTETGLDSVSVLVSVERSLARSVNPNQFQVALNLQNQLPGTFEYVLSEKDITYNNVVGHEGVRVLQISPSRVPLTLDPAIEKNIPIRARYFGDLAPGFIIESIKLQPKTVLVRGAENFVQGLSFINTRPLDVENLNSEVEMQAQLDLPPQVRLANTAETFFTAMITVSSNPQRALFRNIPVRFENARYAYKASNSQVNVHLEGPKDIIDSLDPGKFHAELDLRNFKPGDYRGLTPRVVLPPSVKVLEQWPIVDLFILKRRLK